MLRKCLLGLTTLLCLGLATACRNAQTADAKIVLRLSGWQSNPSESQLLARVLRQFEAQNPGIRVRYEVINSQYMDVIKTRLIGDVAPDVFYLDAFEAPLLMKYGVLEPLDRYISPTFNLADFEPRLLNAFRYKGQLYGIPKDFSTLALFYNRQFFAEAGLTQPPATWAELQRLSQTLTVDRNRDGRVDRYGLGIAPELARQTFMVQAFGGQLVTPQGYATFASPASLQGLEQLVRQYRQDRTAGQPSDVGAASGSEMFGQGKAAMVLEGPWAIPYLKETFPKLQFGTAEVPTVNGKPGTMAYTVAYVMNRQSRQKQAAWKLITYLTSPQGMQAWTSQGLVLPSRRSLLQSLGYRQNLVYAPFAQGASYATVWQAGETLPTILTNFDNQFASALLGEQPLPQAMQRAQNTANREIYLAR